MNETNNPCVVPEFNRMYSSLVFSICSSLTPVQVKYHSAINAV